MTTLSDNVSRHVGLLFDTKPNAASFTAALHAAALLLTSTGQDEGSQ